MSHPEDYDEAPPCEEPKPKIEERIAAVRQANGSSACRVKLLDVAGLHRVTIQRQAREFTNDFYIDDDDQCEAFIVAAIGKLCQPGEDPNQLRQEMRGLISTKCHQYYESNDHLIFDRMSDAVPYELEWLWPGRIAANKLTMLVGDPGIGKSLVSLDIAARVSTGRPWPDEPAFTEAREPGSVLLLAELDDPDDTIRPRLEALGADLERIALLRSFVRAGEEGYLPFSVGGKLKMLTACLGRVPDCKLIVIDPISAYVETNYSRRDLCALLQELQEIANSNEVAILVVSHFSRSNALFHLGSPINSRLAAGARSVWKIVGDGARRDRRVLLPMKNNLWSDWHGLGFRIESARDDYAPQIVWENKPLEITVERATFKNSGPKLLSSRCAKRESVCQWLQSRLAAGAQLAQELFAAARDEQIGEKLLRRALRELGCLSRKGPTGSYVWALPNAQSSRELCANSSELLLVGDENVTAKQGKQGKQANLELPIHETASHGDLENADHFP